MATPNHFIFPHIEFVTNRVTDFASTAMTNQCRHIEQKVLNIVLELTNTLKNAFTLSLLPFVSIAAENTAFIVKNAAFMVDIKHSRKKTQSKNIESVYDSVSL